MDIVEQIKEKLNIIDVISPYVKLRKRGSNWFGLCPFHNEKSGSFSVNEDRGFYHCFGCGESGDIFSFIEKKEHTDFRGALELLARMANVEITDVTIDTKYKEKRNKLIEINETSRKFFTWILKEHKIGERGRKYLEKRKINIKSIDTFGIGYAPTSDQNLYQALKKKGYSDQEIIDAGVCIRRDRDGKIIDKFRGRIMFSIENISGKTVGFSGRHIPIPNPKYEPPKYLNTGETSIFTKGKILYGFNQAKDDVVKLGYIIISEGQVNIVSSHQIGQKNIVASMGTSLTEDHLKLIARYTKNIYFCFDNDAAGHAALVRAAKMALNDDFLVRVISLREGGDPDEEIQKDPALWLGDVEMAYDLFDYLIAEAKKNYKGIDDNNRVIQKFVEIYGSCSNPVTKDALVQKLSEAFDIPVETLHEYFNQKTFNIFEKPKEKDPEPSSSLNVSNTEEFVLALICQNFDSLRDRLLEDHNIYFPNNQEIYLKLSSDNLENIIDDEKYKIKIEEYLTKNIPATEDLFDTFEDSIKRLKVSYIREQVKILKEKLNFADDKTQDEILQQIEGLIKSI